MDSYLTNWFPRYVLIRTKDLEPFTNSYFYTLLDTHLNRASFNNTNVLKACKSNTSSFFIIDIYIEDLFLGNATIIAESDYPITTLTHPELFI